MSSDGRSRPQAGLEERLAALSGDKRRLLERLLRERQATAVAAGVPRLPPADEAADHPLSDGQLGLWLAGQAAPASPAYNMPGMLRLRGELSPPALAAALAAVTARHSALRSRFLVVDGRPVQRVAAPAPVALPLLDLSAVAEPRRSAAARRLAGREAERAFDLEAAPPLRAVLLRLAADHHLLVLTVHHIVADRWAMAVVLEELGVLYAAARRGERATLPRPAAQLIDHCAWQRRRREAGELEEGLEHWRGVLDADESPLEVPADRPRPPQPSGRGGRRGGDLGVAAADVARLAESERATPFMVLLAVYAAFLGRLCGRRRVVVGTPVAGREHAATQRLVGHLVNALPVVVDLGGDPDLRRLLRRVRDAVGAVLSHQEVPFHRLVEELRPRRDPRHHPFFQVMFSYQDLELPVAGFDGLQTELVPLHTGSAQLDLTLVARPGDGGALAADWEYADDLFDGARIDDYAASFATFLAAAVAAPESRLARLPLLAAEQRRRLLVTFNPQRDAVAPAAALPTVHALVERAARRDPTAVAVEMDGRRLTYGELNGQADRLAAALDDLLLQVAARGYEVRVGLCVDRSPEMVTGLLAVLKSGAAVVPLDPAYPPERLAYMSEDAGLAAVVCDAVGEAALPAAGPPRLRLDASTRGEARKDPGTGSGSTLSGGPEEARKVPGTRPTAGGGGAAEGGRVRDPGTREDGLLVRVSGGGEAISPHALAYVIYTSGSTGRPKGVAVSHGAAAEHFVAWAERFGLSPADRVYQFASLSFDAALEQIFPTLAAGARLLLRGPEVPAPQQLARDAEAGGWTVMYLPAAYWQGLTHAWARGDAGAGSLRLVNPGGDVMAVEAVRRQAATPLAAGVTLLNGYGPTEAVVTTAVCEVPVAQWKDGGGAPRVPIGAPFFGRTVHLLDAAGEPLPPGVPGELHVGGPYLARGYLGRPRRTAAAFVPDPFSSRPGARLYRTGDLARWLPDGRLDFLGRVDHQVKVRGFRIELGEVEAALETLPAVDRAVAAAPADASGHRRLVAYLVPAAGTAAADLQPEALRRALGDRLPEHMVPSAWVTLDALPMTPNGKVDRRALPEPSAPTTADGAAAGGDDTPPSGRREEILAALWAEVLALPRVGVRDNFFALGGDSILSLRIIARAHEAGLRLTPSQFFRYPTVAELAAAAETTAAFSAPQEALVGTVPPTPIQRWFFAQDFAEAAHWNQGQAFAVERPVEAAWLHRAAAALFDHHDALRSRFELAGAGESAEPVQVVDPPGGAAPSAVVDLSALPSARRQAAAAAVAAAVQASLDLATGPLGRVVLLSGARPDGGAVLLMVFHHLVVDGVSWRILLEDFAAALAAAADNAAEAPRLPPRTTSLRRWGEVLADLAAAGRFDDEMQHWRAASPATASADAADATGRVATSRRLPVELDEETTRTLLQQAPRAYHTQVNDLLLTALAQAVHAVDGRRELVLELEGHGREEVAPDVDLSRTVGWLTSKFPLRLDLSAVDDPQDPDAAVTLVKETLRAVPGRGFGYGVLRYLAHGPQAEEWAGELEAAAQPELTFNYLGRLDAPQDLAWPLRPLFAAAGPEVGRGNRRPSRLEVVALVLDGRLRLLWDFDAALLPASRVEALATACADALRRLGAHCARRGEARHTLSDFPLADLDAAELALLERSVPGLEDVYPTSPVQQGMLFHSLSAPESGVYVEQLVLELSGPLDAAAFAAAWRRTVERHAVLRTAFLWEGLRRPLSAVARDVELPWSELDWSDADDGERQRRLDELLSTDRRRGFDVGRAPLMRFFLIREAPQRHRFLWCNHHLLVDGWTEPMVLDEVFRLYAAAVEGGSVELPARRPYRDYVEWLAQRDTAAAERFWRHALEGLDGPTLLPPDPAATGEAAAASAATAADITASGTAAPATGAVDHAEEELELPAPLSAALSTLARGAGLTANTLVQGAWLLLLAVYTGRRDVVTGITVSGRPPELPGVDGMIGMFINTLPLRARLDPADTVVDWLCRLQQHTGELLGFEATPLVEVLGWSGLPRGVPLFDTIVVCMNLPRDEEAVGRGAGGLRLERAYGIEQTNYPLTVTARPGERLLLQINYQLRSFTPDRARAVGDHFAALFAALVERPDLTVGEVAGVVEAADRRRRSAAAERLQETRRRAFGDVRRRAARRPVTADQLEEVSS